MNLAATLFCAVTTLLSVQAITVSVDRADVRPVTVPNNGQSMLINGWRPLTNGYDNIGVNVSPSSNLERSFAPLHPVLGKFQEHMSASERLKPQRHGKPIEYNNDPLTFLGTFASFSQAKNPSNDAKSLSNNREYSFLVPPPRSALQFEIEKKTPINDPYVRSSQFVPQAVKPDAQSPTYYIKPASFSTSIHPFGHSRPFVSAYNVQQSLVPQRQPEKQFESAKSANEKPYYQNQQSNVEAQKTNIEQNFARFQQHQLPPQVLNNNFYNQINHPAHYKQSNYERNPGFLVHESHETSYVTPSTFKFRPSYHFETNHNAAQEQFPSSTTAPTKYAQQPPSNTRHESFKQFQITKETEKRRPESQQGPANAFYLTDFQKTRYPPDINEVLPKANQPAKFNQVSTTASPYTAPEQPSKVVYVRPELQQQHYQSSIIPLNINQRPAEVQYETPESISLKHFNEQQFLLQQQLIQQDRQRLREQEKRRQQELQRQQQEELSKRQQEIKQLEQKQKEKQRLEQVRTVKPEVVKEVPQTHQYYTQSYPEESKKSTVDQYKYYTQSFPEEPKKSTVDQYKYYTQSFPEEPKKTTVDQYKYYTQSHTEEPKKTTADQFKYVHYQQFEVPQASSEAPFREETPSKPSTVQKFEELVTPAATPSTTQEDFQPVVRPYRPQKPFRDPLRRRKPTTIAYEPAPTEAPTAPSFNTETQEDLTDIPIQTTSLPEVTTVPATERPVLRTRRPGGPLRRRRPTGRTTTTEEPNVSSQEYEDELIKHNSPEIQDFEKKKSIRPLAGSYQENTADKRPLRKRPGQRGKLYNKEHGNYDGTSGRRTTEQPFSEINPTENYPAPFLKELYSSEYSSSERTQTANSNREVSTENIPIEFYETTVASNLEYYEPTQEDRQELYSQKPEDNAPLDHIFTRTEVNYIETTTSSPSTYSTYSTYSTTPTTTTTTTTTTEIPSTVKATAPIVKATHRMRPIRYGNATRPRFSIKDYKSRMEYKNRLASSSSTEPSTVTVGAKTRGHKNQQAPADPNFKEPSGRFKYMSRSSYRTTSTTTPTNGGADDTTERSSRFTPKKRINTSHYYRSRVSGTTPTSKDNDHTPAHSTARPENVFSSSIRKRPTLKSRLHPKPNAVPTEMQSAAETGSFATTTIISSSSEAANEIPEHEELQAVQEEESPKNEEQKPEDLSDITMDESDNNQPEVTSEAGRVEEPTSSAPESTTSFDIRQEEELFAKASQSVADLTSSASALYDKPGMFKAVSPGGENRAISSHLRISTDEPTLPIEAFFQDLNKKN